MVVVLEECVIDFLFETNVMRGSHKDVITYRKVGGCSCGGINPVNWLFSTFLKSDEIHFSSIHQAAL
jgi:hypothetical protein